MVRGRGAREAVVSGQWIANRTIRTAIGVLRLGCVRHSERVLAQDDKNKELNGAPEGAPLQNTT